MPAPTRPHRSIITHRTAHGNDTRAIFISSFWRCTTRVALTVRMSRRLGGPRPGQPVRAGADEVRRRRPPPDEPDVRAAAHARLAGHLYAHGHPEAAQRYLQAAVDLRPDTWTYRRQSRVLTQETVGQLNVTPGLLGGARRPGGGPVLRPDRHARPPLTPATVPTAASGPCPSDRTLTQGEPLDVAPQRPGQPVGDQSVLRAAASRDRCPTAAGAPLRSTSRGRRVAVRRALRCCRGGRPVPLRDLAAAGQELPAAGYAPLLAALPPEQSGRVEVVPLRNHGEAAIVARHSLLARGWERQVDVAQNAVLYRAAVDPDVYHRWLDERAVSYVALADAPLDWSTQAEVALLARAPDYLEPVAVGGRWHLWRVRDPVPLADPPARVLAADGAGVTLVAAAPSSSTLRLRWSRLLVVSSGAACLAPAPELQTPPDGMRWVRVSFADGGCRPDHQLGAAAPPPCVLSLPGRHAGPPLTRGGVAGVGRSFLRRTRRRRGSRSGCLLEVVVVVLHRLPWARPQVTGTEHDRG